MRPSETADQLKGVAHLAGVLQRLRGPLGRCETCRRDEADTLETCEGRTSARCPRCTAALGRAAENRALLRALERDIDVSEQLVGCAVPYGVRGQLPNGTSEEFAAGAFTQAGAVVARINHDRRVTIGRTDDGSLRLHDTAAGLQFVLRLDTEAARLYRVRERAQRGEFVGCSVRFTASAWAPTASGRAVQSARLIEVSLVAAPKSPVYRATWVRMGGR